MTKKVLVRTSTNIGKFEKYKGEALNYNAEGAVPNQSMSVEEIIRRFASGSVIDGAKPHYYGGEAFEDEDILQTQRLDLVDIHAMDVEIKQKIKKQKQDAKAAELQAKQQAKTKEEDYPKSDGNQKVKGGNGVDDERPMVDEAKEKTLGSRSGEAEKK